jgi:hypothetical protein
MANGIVRTVSLNSLEEITSKYGHSNLQWPHALCVSAKQNLEANHIVQIGALNLF